MKSFNGWTKMVDPKSKIALKRDIALSWTGNRFGKERNAIAGKISIVSFLHPDGMRQ
jgi:hypothetical protein